MEAPKVLSADEYREKFEPVVVNPATGVGFRIRRIRPAELLLDGILKMPELEHSKSLVGKPIEQYDMKDLAVAQLIATAILVRGVVSMRLVDKARGECAPGEISARAGEGLDEADREFLVNEITKLSGLHEVDAPVLSPVGAATDNFRDAGGSE
jgi:hypothetical protein